MKQLYQLLLFIFFAASASAQSRDKLTLGGGVMPLATWSFNTSSSNDPVKKGGTQTFKQYADSVSAHETYRYSFAIGVVGNYLLNQKWSVQFGLSYLDIGFQRQQKDIQFMDYTHPGIGKGRILDLTSAKRSIDYNYRYQYLQIPAMMNYTFKQSRDYRWLFQVSSGVGVNVLLKHQMTAVLNQFTEDGESEFDIDSTGYEGYRMAVNVFVGAKAEYRYEKKTTLFIQPLLGFYPVSVSASPVNVFPFFFGINLGAVYTLEAN